MAKRANNDKLRLWQDRLSRNESAYESEASRMDEREALYAGVNQLRAIVRGERKTQTPHVRNICAELIEAQKHPAAEGHGPAEEGRDEGQAHRRYAPQRAGQDAV